MYFNMVLGFLFCIMTLIIKSMNPFSDNKVPYHNATSYDSNAALGGQMENKDTMND